MAAPVSPVPQSINELRIYLGSDNNVWAVSTSEGRGWLLAQVSDLSAPGALPGGEAQAGIDFSLSEQFSGRHWLDGKKVYQKTVQFSSIPQGETTVAHGISALANVIEIQGAAFNGTNHFRIPHVDPMYPTYEVGVWADATNLALRAGTGDLSAFTWVYLTMHYTCTDR
jgi:hypothetical protein